MAKRSGSGKERPADGGDAGGKDEAGREAEDAASASASGGEGGRGGGSGPGDAPASDVGRPAAFVPRDVTLLHLWHFQIVRDLLVIASIVCVLWLGYALRAVTVPLLVALLLAYLFEPVVAKIASRPQFSRAGAVTGLLALVILLVTLSVIVVLPLVVGQTSQLVRDVNDGRTRTSIARLEKWVPEGYRDEFRLFLDQLPAGDGSILPAPVERSDGEADGAADGEADETAAGGGADAAAAGDEPAADAAGGLDEQQVVALVERRVQELLAEREAARIAAETLAVPDGGGGAGGAGLGGNVIAILQRTLDTVTGILGFAVQVGLLAFLIPFYFFFFSVSYPKIVEFGRAFVPRRNRDRTLELLGKMDSVVAGFVRGRIVICMIMGVLFALGWLIVGVPYALPLGIVVGVFSAVPYLGGVGLPLAVGLLLFEQLAAPPDDRMAMWAVFVLPTAVFFVVQLVEGYVLIPAIAGKATDLDPVTIVVAVLAGGSVLGVYGMLLAIPAAACGKIMIKEVLLPNLHAWLEGRRRDPLPIGRGPRPRRG